MSLLESMKALKEISDKDDSELASDPTWAKRVAEQAMWSMKNYPMAFGLSKSEIHSAIGMAMLEHPPILTNNSGKYKINLEKTLYAVVDSVYEMQRRYEEQIKPDDSVEVSHETVLEAPDDDKAMVVEVVMYICGVIGVLVGCVFVGVLVAFFVDKAIP